MEEEELTNEIIGAAIEVHKHWGPGLYEEIYERSFCHELKLRKVNYQNQFPLPLLYKGERIGDELKLDVLIEKKVVVEMKHVKELLPVHKAQLMTYMRLTDCKVGLLINFNVSLLKEGIQRVVL